MTQAQLADKCGWDSKGQTRIANYENDRREPNLTDLKRIAQALGLNLIDLLEDELLTTTPPSNYESDDFVIIQQHTASGSAGNGHMNDHVEVNGGLAFKRSWLQRKGLKPSNLHVIYVKGDSMEPTISDGDVVLIDKSQKEPHSNWVFVLRQDDELLIKRMIRSITSKWIIRSDNENKIRYPDFEISPQDLETLSIVGRVVWHAGML